MTNQIQTGKPARPVQLQLNNSGSWKTVAWLDAGDDKAVEDAMQAVQLLGEICRKATWRIATEEPYPVVLRRWSKADGWKDLIHA